jgi:two-component system, cell cycle sensor histidine kinase and response regulator CckA
MQDEPGAMSPASSVPTTAEALWNATERLRAMEEAAPAGIVAFDLEGRVTIWNRAAEELFGWSRSEVVGRLYPLNPDDLKDEHAALVARVLAGQSLSGLETCKLRKDRTSVSISLSCGPIRDADGRVCGTMQVLTDISEAKRLQQQFLQAQKMEAFGQLAGGVAHDFNNLLTVIMGFTELMTEQLRDQPLVLSDLEEIAKAGERASQLTRQLLAFSRKQAWVLQVLDVNEVIAHFEKMLSRIVREDIQLEILPQRELEHTKADPGQIEQLLMNLVVNARDAMPKGGTLTIATANVRLDAELARQLGGAPGRYVSLTVKDTGSGMTPDVRARAFEPFFTTKGAGKGTGLGLSTVAGLAEQSGGFVTIDSAPGAGTTVTTYWPAVDDSIEPAMEESSPATLNGTETILLVEDETGVRQLIGKVLERYGYKVLPAGDAERAIAIEAGYADPIALLVSDLIMPGLNGPELARIIVERRPDIRVLFVSGYASREAVEESLTTRNASFLSKPFTPEKLARKVRDRLDRPAILRPAADPDR